MKTKDSVMEACAWRGAQSIEMKSKAKSSGTVESDRERGRRALHWWIFSFHGRMWIKWNGQENFIYSWHINSDVWHSLGRCEKRTIMQLICPNWILNVADPFSFSFFDSATNNVQTFDDRWFISQLIVRLCGHNNSRLEKEKWMSEWMDE